VALFGSAPLVLIADKSFSAHNVKELIALAKAKPGYLNFGSGGVGTSPHMAGVVFSKMADVNIVSIPYPGEQAVITDILGGRVSFMFANASSALPQIKGGCMQGLAVTCAERVAVVPDVPTVADAGVPGFEAGTWLGLLAPAKTPDETVNLINAEVRRVLALPDVKEKLNALGFTLSNDSPAKFEKYTKSKYVKWGNLIRDANIKAE
jgi:tripartite-type tricarboxylate transporter receptor subunit TctC